MSRTKLLRLIPAAALLLVLMTPNISSAAKATKPQKVAKAESTAAQAESAGQSVTSAPSEPELDYWLTVDSVGVRRRHNYKCRFYENGKGRPCTKDEGKPCSNCGG